MSIRDLIDRSSKTIKLDILVFGPQTRVTSKDERTRKHQLKRIEIREALEAEGHNVRFAEDEVDPSIGANTMLQEEVLMREFDMIINIIDSPGSILEAGWITRSPKLAPKSQLFLDEDFTDGLVAEACRLGARMGAHFHEYKYPDALDHCHLLGYARQRVEDVQMMKFLD